jgi:hypothetical protein
LPGRDGFRDQPVALQHGVPHGYRRAVDLDKGARSQRPDGDGRVVTGVGKDYFGHLIPFRQHHESYRLESDGYVKRTERQSM